MGIRGMIPHKTYRGADAMSRLTCFEGIPHPHDKVKRKVIPAALRVIRLQPDSNYTVLGDLAHSVGWKFQDLLVKLEDKRKARIELKEKAIEAASSELAEVNKTLAGYGY